MKEAVLIFPDSKLLSDFVRDNNINPIHISSCETRLTGIFDDQTIAISWALYMAYVDKVIYSY